MSFEFHNLKTTELKPGEFLKELFKDKDQVLFIKNINQNRMYKMFYKLDDDNKDVFLFIDQNDLHVAKESNIRFTRTGRFEEVIYGGRPLTSYEQINTKVVSLKLSNENKRYSVPAGYFDVLIVSNNKIYMITKDQFNSLLITFSVLGISDNYWLELRDTEQDMREDADKGYEANKNAVVGLKDIHMIGVEQYRHTPEYYEIPDAEYVDVEVVE